MRIFLLLSLIACSLTLFAQSTKVEITAIEIMGNKKTKARIITRELDFKVGDSLDIANSKRIQRNENMIINSGLFVAAEITLIDIDQESQRAKVLISVKEDWYIYPSPTWSFADRNFNVWWENFRWDWRRVNIGLTMVHTNFTGHADELKITLQEGFTRKFELRYRYPYLNKAQTIGIETGILYSDQNDIRYQTEEDIDVFLRDTTKNIFSRFRARLGLQYRPSIFERHRLTFQYQDLGIDQTVAELNPNYFLEGALRQRTFRLQYQFTSDRRDNRFYAMRGHAWDIQLTKEGLGIFNNLNTLTLAASFSKHWSFTEKISLKTSLKGHAAFIRDLYPYHNYRALGSSSNLVRGYQLYLVDGLDYGYLKTDVRYRMLDFVLNLGKLMPIKSYRSVPIQTYFVLHNDMGYVNEPFFNDDSNMLDNSFLLGYGAGVDFVFQGKHVIQLVLTRNNWKEWGFIIDTDLGF